MTKSQSVVFYVVVVAWILTCTFLHITLDWNLGQTIVGTLAGCGVAVYIKGWMK